MNLCDELLKINHQFSRSNSARIDPTEYDPEQNTKFCICGDLLPRGKDFCSDICELRSVDERTEIFEEEEGENELT